MSSLPVARWTDAIVQAGAVPASHVPEESLGRTDLPEVSDAELVEHSDLRVSPSDPAGPTPPAVSFLDGIQRWRVTYYDGVAPIVRGYVAAAVRRRADDRRLRTARTAAREFHAAARAALRPAVLAALEASGLPLLDVPEAVAQPGRADEAAKRAVENERVTIEKKLGEEHVSTLAPDEWMVIDGLLSESALLARHPRTVAVIKSHGAQYFEGDALTRALTIPVGHRTSVFRPRGRARNEVYSWYLRLWPWEGNHLLFGLVRVEARAAPETIAAASALSGWLVRERAPVSTPDPRWDRLLYPIHDVENYLKARAPREVLPFPASRFPKAS